jgi:tetratricopeptide (TPR) repeat protein
LDKAVARQFAIGQYWQKRYQKDPENILTPNIVDKTRPFNDLQGSSLRAFEKVRLNHPTGALADDSLMATANANFLRNRYEDADYYYGLVRREYPNSEHQYQAHFLGIQAKIRCYLGPQYDGMCLQEAKELIEQTIRQFAKLSAEDRQRLQRLHAQVLANLAFRDYEIAQFYANKGYHAAAKVYYNRVILEFPHTEVASKAQQQLEKIEGEPSVPPPRLVWISSLFPETRKDPLVLGKTPAAGENSQ